MPKRSGQRWRVLRIAPHRQKKRPRPVCRCKKRRRGASFGISRTRSVLPPARTGPQSRQAVPLPPGLCACNGMREASSTSRTDPSPPGHSASSWVLCVRRRACKVPSSRPHRSPNPGKPFRFLLVFVHATACAKRPPPPALILVPQAILLPPGFCACGGVRARYLPPARTGPPIPASRFTSSWSLCVRRCAPMRAVSRTCGAKFSGVAQKGAPSS